MQEFYTDEEIEQFRKDKIENDRIAAEIVDRDPFWGTLTGRLTPNVIHSQDAYFLQNSTRMIEEAKDIYTIDYSRLEERCLAIMAQDSERRIGSALFGYPYGMEVIQPQGVQPMSLYTDGFRYIHDAAYWDPKGAIRDLLRTLPKRKRRRVRGKIKAAIRKGRN